MPRTQLEKSISRRRHAEGVLVPFIERFMQESQAWSDIDEKFISAVIKQGRKTEMLREIRPVFSPSALASCLRQVYLNRHWEQLEITRIRLPRPEPAGYFLQGNFIHLKWQHVMMRMDEFYEDDVFKLIAVEHRVQSKRGDHAGTIDVIAEVWKEPYIVDFKGLNTYGFQKIVSRDVPGSYRLQLADYMILWNSDKKGRMSVGYDKRIEKALLVAENKGGPDPKHPLALHEHGIQLEDYADEVRLRLRQLREHERDHTVPLPECTQTTSLQFKGCPFQGFCKKEVKRVEEAASKRNPPPSVRKSNRSRRRR